MDTKPRTWQKGYVGSLGRTWYLRKEHEQAASVQKISRNTCTFTKSGHGGQQKTNASLDTRGLMVRVIVEEGVYQSDNTCTCTQIPADTECTDCSRVPRPCSSLTLKKWCMWTGSLCGCEEPHTHLVWDKCVSFNLPVDKQTRQDQWLTQAWDLLLLVSQDGQHMM